MIKLENIAKNILNEASIIDSNGVKAKLVLDVGKNPTKAGVRITFYPTDAEGDIDLDSYKTEIQQKLNDGLESHKLIADYDTDGPSNGIRFIIRIGSFESIIKNIFKKGKDEETEDENA